MSRIYQTVMPPRDYQRIANAKMRGKKAFALLMAMRTGKTKVALDDFGEAELNREVDDMIVIAPGGAYKTWRTAMNDHLSDDLANRMKLHVWESKKLVRLTKERKAFLEAPSPRTLLMNIEALSREGDARDFIETMLAQKRRVVCIVDESTSIKNHKAKRTKYINRVVAPQAARRRILSGLPTPRDPLDIYSQFEFLDRDILGFDSYWFFQCRFAITRTEFFHNKKQRVTIVVGFQPDTNDEIHRLIEPYSHRVEFRPNIPPTYSIREVEMTKEQEKAYEEMKTFATAKLEESGSHVTATVVIAQLLKMHQILLGHTIDENGVERFLEENRTEGLKELLEDYAGKAVIWCSYDHDVRKATAMLEKEYGPGSVARFWGGNVATREAEEVAFKTDAKCRFMIATPDAGRFSRDWSVANLVIYFSSRDNLEHRDQSEHRVNATTKMEGVDYIDMIVPGTVEEKILHALRNKIDMAAAINGDNWREWVV